jgi:hypothetical protein
MGSGGMVNDNGLTVEFLPIQLIQLCKLPLYKVSSSGVSISGDLHSGKYLRVGGKEMRRSLTLLVVVLMMSVLVVGCGGNNSAGTEPGQATGGSVELGDGKKINYGTAEQGKSLDLPENYPIDVLPLIDDSVISFVNTNDSTQGIGILLLTDRSFEDAIAFYQGVMEQGKITMETQQDDMYLIIGNKDSYSITISITHPEGEKVNVLLDITP